jgi:hypothetical protein
MQPRVQRNPLHPFGYPGSSCARHLYVPAQQNRERGNYLRFV